MKGVFFVVLGILAGGPAVFADDDLAAPQLSTKIWDDFSFQNLGSKAHKALGYGTVALGYATMLVQQLDHDPSQQAYQILGQTSAILAGATLLSGAVVHWDKLSFQGDLLTWHNLHALTAVVGASLLATSGFLDVGSPWRAPLGEAGTVILSVAIVWEG